MAPVTELAWLASGTRAGEGRERDSGSASGANDIRSHPLIKSRRAIAVRPAHDGRTDARSYEKRDRPPLTTQPETIADRGIPIARQRRLGHAGIDEAWLPDETASWNAIAGTQVRTVAVPEAAHAMSGSAARPADLSGAPRCVALVAGHGIDDAVELGRRRAAVGGRLIVRDGPDVRQVRRKARRGQDRTYRGSSRSGRLAFGARCRAVRNQKRQRRNGQAGARQGLCTPMRRDGADYLVRISLSLRVWRRR